MSKDIAFDNETRTKMAAGVNKLADAVRVTIGPKGRYVAMQKEHEKPNVSNDGATVAANVDLEDPIENMGMKIVREAAIAANNDAGDGTTTATILSDAIVSEGVRCVISGSDPLALRRGIQRAADVVADEVLKNAVEVTTREQIAEIATVSAGDRQIGEKIAEAMDAIGRDGVISVEKSQNFGIEVKILKGMMFDNGFISPYMADDPARLEGELTEPYILLTDQRLGDNFADIVPVLEEVMQSGHPLLIAAEDVRGEALNTLLMNRRRGTLTSVAVKAPALGDRRKAELEDLAILTGGEVITPDRGLTLADARKSMLGRAASVQITKDRTTILGGKGTPEAIEQRCDQLRAQIETEKIDYDRDVLRERLAKLSSGIAVMEVGAATESEMNEIRSRIQDALLATRSAAEQGLVAGGGVALLQAASALDGLVCENAEEQLGIDILRKALEVPLRALAENAGYRGDVAVEKVKELPLGQGLDCMTGEYGDMIGRGIADPAKVTVTALQAAASVASLILITNASVSEMVPEEDYRPRRNPVLPCGPAQSRGPAVVRHGVRSFPFNRYAAPVIRACP